MSNIKVVVVKNKQQANNAYDLLLDMIHTMGYNENPLRDEFIKSVLENPSRIAFFLAIENKLPVGIASLGVDFSPYEATFQAFLKALYVIPEKRGKGIAELIFTAVKKETKKRRLKGGLFWLVHQNNKASLSFFEKRPEVSKHGKEALHLFVLPYEKL